MTEVQPLKLFCGILEKKYSHVLGPLLFYTAQFCEASRFRPKIILIPLLVQLCWCYV